MNIEQVVCPETVADKLAAKHRVSVAEARQLLYNSPRSRFTEKGRTPGEDVYVAFGQTFSGRYLTVFFVYKPNTGSLRRH